MSFCPDRGVQPSIGIRLRRTFNQIADVVVRGILVPLENAQLNLEGRLVSSNMLQEVLVPNGVEGVPNDARTEYLLAERDDNEWVHVPSLYTLLVNRPVLAY